MSVFSLFQGCSMQRKMCFPDECLLVLEPRIIRETESQRYVRVWAAERKSSGFQKAPHIDCGMGKNDFPESHKTRISARLQLSILLGCCHQYNVLGCWLTDIYGFGATGLSPCVFWSEHEGDKALKLWSVLKRNFLPWVKVKHKW